MLILLAAPFPKTPTEVPQLIEKTEPRCTDAALEAAINDTVHLGFMVNEKGRVVSPKVVKTPGYGLGERAIEAVSEWRFEPGRKDGEPIAVKAATEMRFNCKK